jgi:hypothetical protein
MIPEDLPRSPARLRGPSVPCPFHFGAAPVPPASALLCLLGRTTVAMPQQLRLQGLLQAQCLVAPTYSVKYMGHGPAQHIQAYGNRSSSNRREGRRTFFSGPNDSAQQSACRPSAALPFSLSVFLVVTTQNTNSA